MPGVARGSCSRETNTPFRRGTRQRPPSPAGLPPGEPFSAAATRAVAVYDCPIGYAADVLAGLGLGDWGWLIHDLAETIDDAALSAVSHWLLAPRAGLETAACLPRWCPCGKWPDFGAGCWSRAPCRCAEMRLVSANLAGPSYSALGLSDSTCGWSPDWREYTGFPPILTRGCPVHPDGLVPHDVLQVWSSRGHGHGSLLIGGELGLPACLGTAPEEGTGDAG
jgi:hypothetical protein